MTQTSDDSSNSGCNTATTSTLTVIMDHDTEEKSTVAPINSPVCKEKEEPKGKSNETATPPTLAVAHHGIVDVGVTSSPAISAANIPSENCIVDDEIDMCTETSSSSFTKAPMCAICSEPCICYCKACKKASYCSKEHQRKHWKQHRPECYPVTVQVNSVFGSHLIVTRDIKRGEVILREKPLMHGPAFTLRYLQEKDPRPQETYHLDGEYQSGKVAQCNNICLSCHKILMDASSSPCTKCGWPICCPECEKNPTHAEQECKMFAEYHLEPSMLCDKDAQYLCISLARVLQHKKWDPIKWSQFMDVVNKQPPMKDGLNAQAEAKKSTARFSDLITKSLGPIFHNEYSLTDVEIDQIVRTLRTNTFITDSDGNYINGFGSSNNDNLGHITARNRSRCNGKCVSVYHLASMLTSNCIPNASWVIQESLEFYLRASAPIKTGERITITYVDPMLGTWDRRKELWKEKYLSCSCSRCADPTELGTFFSAIKCPGKRRENEGESTDGICECEGYILLQDPLAVTYTSYHVGRENDVGNDDLPGEELCEETVAEWKCNVCLMRQPRGFVQSSLQRISLQDDDICLTNNVRNGNTDGNVKSEALDNMNERNELGKCSKLKLLEARVDKLENIVRRYAHMNHYNVLRMENEILSSISRMLEQGLVPFDEMEGWALRMVQYCKKGLKAVNVLCPGLSKPRGRYLYFLQQGLAIILLFKTSRAMRIDSFDQINSAGNNASCNDELVKKFQELILARKELIEIFAIERENSEERAMLKAAQQDSIEIRLLKNVFKYHQNVTCNHL